MCSLLHLVLAVCWHALSSSWVFIMFVQVWSPRPDSEPVVFVTKLLRNWSRLMGDNWVPCSGARAYFRLDIKKRKLHECFHELFSPSQCTWLFNIGQQDTAGEEESRGWGGEGDREWGNAGTLSTQAVEAFVGGNWFGSPLNVLGNGKGFFPQNNKSTDRDSAYHFRQILFPSGETGHRRNYQMVIEFPIFSSNQIKSTSGGSPRFPKVFLGSCLTIWLSTEI